MRARTVRLFDLSALLWVGLLVLGLFLYAGSPEDAQQRRQSFTRAVDNLLGDMSVGQLVTEYGGVNEDPALNARVQRIFDALVAPVKNDRDDLNYRIQVLNSDVPNAFALPGGRTYITKGLLDLLESDDEVAGVLGHELAHTARSHGSTAFGRDIGMILAYDFVLNRIEEPSRQQAAELAQLSYALISTGYSRAAETEADKLGLRYAAAAGYHPLGLVQALEKIEQYQRKNRPTGAVDVPVYFRTHPLTEDRVRALRAEAKELGYDVYVPGDAVHEALRRLTESEQQEADGP